MKLLLGLILITAGLARAVPFVVTPQLEPAVPGRHLFARTAPGHPRVGLVLSGGGARGIAHIGVLAALHDAGIRIDYVVGTSIGAAVGALYAAGYSPRELERLGSRIDWNGLFSDAPSRSNLFATQGHRSDHFLELAFHGVRPVLPSGYSGGQRLTGLLTDLFLRARFRPERTFDDLSVPFRAVSTDLVTGRRVVHASGSLSRTVRASMSVPLFFTPVAAGSLLLVDGGLVSCVPVDVARELGSDVVIASDMAGLLRDRDELDEPMVIADQVMSIMMRIPNRLQREQADVVVRPRVREYDPADFGSYNRLIAAGRTAMETMLDSVARVIRRSGASADTARFLLRELRVTGVGVPGDSIRHTAGLVLPGSTVTRALQDAVNRVYALGWTDSVAMTVWPDSGSAELRVRPRPVVTAVRVTGGVLLPGSELRDPFNSLEGKRLDTRAVENAASVLRERYRHRGYTLMRVNTAACRGGTLAVDIDEGQVGGFEIEGNDRTAGYVISREFRLLPGGAFNINPVTRGIGNLYGTGLFSYVSADVHGNGATRRLVVSVKEKHAAVLRLGVRFGLAEGSAAFTELYNRNLLGAGMDGRLRLQYGEQRRGITLGCGTERVGTSYFSARARLQYRFRNWTYRSVSGNAVDAERERWEAFAYAGSHIRRVGHTALGIRYVRVVDWHGGGVYADEIKGIRLRTVVNTFDRYPFPRTGKRNTFTFDTGQSLRTGRLYVRLLARLEGVYRPCGSCTVHPRIVLGAGDFNVPFSERFFVGGWSPVPEGIGLPGYAENELWGRNVLLAGTTFRYRFGRNLHLTLRAVAGYVNDDVDFIGNRLVFDWDRFRDTFSSGLYAGGGCGFGIETPLGPAEAGYALGDRAADTAGRAYVQLGYVF